MRLELKDITKRFPGVLANDRISISVDRGEVLGLLGENGAGKSTLMNILSGPVPAGLRRDPHRRDAAHLHGSAPGHRRRHRHGPPALPARARLRRRRGGRPGRRERHRPARHVRPQGRPPARRRAVRAVRPQRQPGREDRGPPRRRAPAGGDPQGALPQERHPRPGRAVRGPDARSRRRSCSGSSAAWPAAGTTVIFITHKLNEVLEVADRITVLRRGRVAGTVEPKDATREILANLMVGRDVELKVVKDPADPGEVVLTIKDLHVRDDRRALAVKGVSLDVRAGEIVALAGRPGQRPDRARRGDRRPPDGRTRATIIIDGHRTSPRPRRGRSRTSASPTSPRIGCATA